MDKELSEQIYANLKAVGGGVLLVIQPPVESRLEAMYITCKLNSGEKPITPNLIVEVVTDMANRIKPFYLNHRETK